MKKDQKKIKNYDLTKVLKKEHEGKWVALTRDYTKVVDFADDPQELESKVSGKDVVFMKALSTNASYAF